MQQANAALGVHRVAMLGNHMPRQCGIATFTTDLTDAVIAVSPSIDCFVIAMNDPEGVTPTLPGCVSKSGK